MYEEYYEELDANKRKKILDSLTPEPGQEETLEQMRRLFDIRYKRGKRIKKNKEVKADKAAAKEAAKEARKSKDSPANKGSQDNKVFNFAADVSDEYTYNDGFIVSLVNIRNVAFDPRDRFGGKADAKVVQDAVHTLCLDRTDEFSEDVLYHEMRQLLAVYVHTALDDSHYQSIVLGMGRMKNSQIRSKLTMDMHYFWIPVAKFLGEENYQFYKNAIADTIEKFDLEA